MPLMEINSSNLDHTLENNQTVILDFWAAWCGPCKTFAPVFEAAARKHEDIVFGKLDTEKNHEIAVNYRVSSIPTVMAFKNKKMVYSQTGALTPAQFEEFIEKIKNL